jgi:hypothetical protein
VPVTFSLTTIVVGAPQQPGTISNSQTTSDNWAGYVNDSGLDYVASYVDWTEPSLAATSVTRYQSLGAGLGSGSDTGHTLAQTGTQVETNSGGVSSKWWYEFYPQEAEQTVSGFPIAGGNSVGSGVEFLSSTGTTFTVEFFLYNYTAGKYTTFDKTVSGSIGTQADAIIERPTVGGTLYDLTDFGTVPADDSFDLSDGSTQCAGTDPDVKYVMFNSSGTTELAHPEFTAPDGCTFDFDRSPGD